MGAVVLALPGGAVAQAPQGQAETCRPHFLSPGSLRPEPTVPPPAHQAQVPQTVGPFPAVAGGTFISGR